MCKKQKLLSKHGAMTAEKKMEENGKLFERLRDEWNRRTVSSKSSRRRATSASAKRELARYNRDHEERCWLESHLEPEMIDLCFDLVD